MTYRIADRVVTMAPSGIRKLFDAGGPDAINLGIGQPDFVTPDHIREAAIRAIREGHTGYTPNAGIPELVEAVADKFRRENGLSVDPSGVMVTAGASEALHLVMEALVNPGDRVLVPDPGFVSYASLARVAGGIPAGIPLDEGMHLDVESARELMDDARLLVLNSPSNPTGMVEPEENIRALVEYAMDRGVTVASDEVYEHFLYTGSHVSAARFGDDVITINATSKTYAMTGWRVGYLAAPEEYIPEFIKIHQYCQACATSIAQYAALAAITGDQTCVSEMREEYRARRDLLYPGLKECGFSFPEPEGAFYMFVPMEPDVRDALIADGVIMVPGEAFGENATDHVRISYAQPRDRLQEALSRIRARTE